MRGRRGLWTGIQKGTAVSKTLRIEYLHGEIRDVTVTAAMTAREFAELDKRFVADAYTEGYALLSNGYLAENLAENLLGGQPGYVYNASDHTLRGLGAEETVYVNFIDDDAIAGWARQLKDLKKRHAIKTSKAKPEAE